MYSSLVGGVASDLSPSPTRLIFEPKIGLEREFANWNSQYKLS